MGCGLGGCVGPRERAALDTSAVLYLGAPLTHSTYHFATWAHFHGNPWHLARSWKFSSAIISMTYNERSSGCHSQERLFSHSQVQVKKYFPVTARFSFEFKVAVEVSIVAGDYRVAGL